MRFGSVGLKCEDGGEKVFFGTVRNGIVRICESIPSNTKHPKSPQKRRGASGLFISGCQRTPLAGFAPTSQPVAFVIYCHSSLQRLVVLCDCRWFSLMVRWAVLLLIIPRWNPAQIHMNFSFCKRQFSVSGCIAGARSDLVPFRPIHAVPTDNDQRQQTLCEVSSDRSFLPTAAALVCRVVERLRRDVPQRGDCRRLANWPFE